jgi:hypothetical protein
MIENLYFEALKRIRSNRVITLEIFIFGKEDLKIFNEVIQCISAQ